MKRLICAAALFSVVAWAGTSQAASYTSWCEADSSLGDSDAGPTNASVSSDTAAASARVDGWDVGVQAWTDWDTFSDLESLYAHAEFSQDFVVTAAGSASISVVYEGIIDAFGIYNTGVWMIRTEAEVSDTTGQGNSWFYDLNESDVDPSSVVASTDVHDEYTFTYDFSTADVGDVFSIDFLLETSIESGDIDFGDGLLLLTSDFYNSLKIVDVSGGVSSVVPSPGGAGSIPAMLQLLLLQP